jgi:hypothetical protein
VPFVMPPEARRYEHWDRLFDTYDGDMELVRIDMSKPYLMRPRSIALFRHQPGT